jgi:FtsP/CotA-like multicopper oxidase with cupredoxin domain
MRVRAGSLVLALAACSEPSTTPIGETGTESESETTTSTETSTETEDSGSESTTGEPDLPLPDERPELRSPAEAEDLDPDPNIVRVALTAAPLTYEVAGETIEGWAYNGQIPGPTIRVERGDTLIVEFHNGLDDDTTIHWHGLHVPIEMDGAIHSGPGPIAPGQDFVYTFEIDQAGTYWYHPHIDSDRQVDLGLYGVIIAEDPADPLPDRELVVVFDSWGEYELDESDHDHGLDGANIQWTANGLIDPVFPASAGERIRVRMVDVANAGYLDLRSPDLRWIGSDQGLLPDLAEPDSVVLAPGDRMDGEWLIGEGFDVTALPYSLLGAPALGEDVRLFEVTVDTPGEPPAALDFPFEGAEPTPDPGFTDIVYAFHGDPHTGKWTINGELFPDITMETLPLGQWSVIELRNISQSAHPFHLHGHAFEVLTIDGIAPEYRVFEDTFDVAPYSIVRLGLLANNPGEWMAHCHILPHAEGGMMTMLMVE